MSYTHQTALFDLSARNNCTDNPKQKDTRTHASKQKKIQQHYFMREILSHAPTPKNKNTNNRLRNR
jgi:hypothetical protein